MTTPESAPLIAIACGGTGGHLFPGLAVAAALADRGSEVLLLVTPRQVDQETTKTIRDLRVATVASAAFRWSQPLAFAKALRCAYSQARDLFAPQPPQALLAMGSYPSVGPAMAAAARHCPVFLHEANSIPGRANRWLAHLAQTAFVYFPDAADRLPHQQVRVSGMPVRDQFHPTEAASCRMMLGLAQDRPTLLVTGGSQGASAINDLVLASLPHLAAQEPNLQYLHLTGPRDTDKVRQAYASHRLRAVVRPFLTEMECALGAATLAVSRAGASSLAEQAAMGLPAILIPYPTAADNHQYHNAKAFVETGAARMLEQSDATPESLVREIRGLLRDESRQQTLRDALRRWHRPQAADSIADALLRAANATARPDTSTAIWRRGAPALNLETAPPPPPA